MAIEERLNGSAHGGKVAAYDRIDTVTGLRVGFRIVCPAGWRIEGNMAGTPFAFTADEIAALGGLIPLDPHQQKIQIPDGPDGELDYPEVEFTVRK